jgi:hypothetical protein
MRASVLILIVIAFVAKARANVGLYPVTKQNASAVKEFSLQTRSLPDGKMEFLITIPYDAKIKKTKYRLPALV